MTKKQLEETVLLHAEHGRKLMIEQHGSFHQQAVIVDRRGGMHVIVIGDEVLHGPKMRALLIAYAASVGGADAILVQSDARVKKMDKDELKKVEEAAARGKYTIGEDLRNQEVFITAGRSREHQACIFQPYQREPGNIIVFETPEPAFDDKYAEVQINLIPDIWEKVN